MVSASSAPSAVRGSPAGPIQRLGAGLGRRVEEAFEDSEVPGQLLAPEPVQRPEAVLAAFDDAGAFEDAEVVRDEGRGHAQGLADAAAGDVACLRGEQLYDAEAVLVGERREDPYHGPGRRATLRVCHAILQP